MHRSAEEAPKGADPVRGVDKDYKEKNSETLIFFLFLILPTVCIYRFFLCMLQTSGHPFCILFLLYLYAATSCDAPNIPTLCKILAQNKKLRKGNKTHKNSIKNIYTGKLPPPGQLTKSSTWGISP